MEFLEGNSGGGIPSHRHFFNLRVAYFVSGNPSLIIFKGHFAFLIGRTQLRILLTAATFAIALTATPAQARAGYAACVAIQPSKNRLLWTNPVAAEDSSMATLAAKFAATLRDKSYASDPELSEYCKFFMQQKDAMEFIMSIRQNHNGPVGPGVPFSG
jgi:hypothetical protein